MKKTKKDISYLKQFRIMIQTIWKMNPLFIILMVADIIISSASTFPAILFPKYIIDALVEGRELPQCPECRALSLLFYSIRRVFFCSLRARGFNFWDIAFHSLLSPPSPGY